MTMNSGVEYGKNGSLRGDSLGKKKNVLTKSGLFLLVLYLNMLREDREGSVGQMVSDVEGRRRRRFTRGRGIRGWHNCQVL